MNRHQRQFTCVRCGYNIVGAQVGSPCPECGHLIGNTVSQGKNGWSIASLVLGIFSIVSCMGYGIGIVFGGLAIWFAAKANEAVRLGQADHSTLGVARAGKVCGIIGLSLGALALLALIAIFSLALFGAAQGSSPMPTP